MLVVLSIIAILSSIGVLAFASYRQQRLVPESARRLVTLLTAAREHAIAEDRLFQALIDIDRNLAWIDRVGPQPADFAPKIVAPVELPDMVRIASVKHDGVESASGRVAIVFHPDGTADTAVIHLVEEFANPADTSKAFSVMVYHSTGRAHVIERALK